MSSEPDTTPPDSERSAAAALLSDATLDRAAWALDYKMRAMAPMLREAEERRSRELAAALREGADNDLKAFDEIQEVRARRDNDLAQAPAGANQTQHPK